MRFTFGVFVVRAGTFLPILGLVVLAGCNHGDADRIPIPGLCEAEMSDLVGTWEITSPVPEPVSTLSSCSDPSLDGRPVGIRSDIYCESILPCPTVVTFQVTALEPQLDGGFTFAGTGGNGTNRLDGSVSLLTCGVGLTIIQTENPAHISCHGILDGSTRTISLSCESADVDTGSGPLIPCEVQPPIEVEIAITPILVFYPN